MKQQKKKTKEARMRIMKKMKTSVILRKKMTIPLMSAEILGPNKVSQIGRNRELVHLVSKYNTLRQHSSYVFSSRSIKKFFSYTKTTYYHSKNLR